MLIPKTRKEIYQAYLSGDTHLALPKPVTRDEIILYNACINGAGTNPSWNDLTDKPFYETVQKNYVTETGVIPMYGNGTLDLIYGKEYIVEINGVQYKAICHFVTYGMSGNELKYLGNFELGSFENVLVQPDKTYPFFVYEDIMNNRYGVDLDPKVYPDGAEVIMYTEETKYHTLNPEYLPKADAVADVTDAPTAEEFNALLASLREAGYLAT